MSAIVCVFAKPPRAGRAKTRLIPAVGARGAAALAEAMFRDTWDVVRSRPWADGVVASTRAIDPAPGGEVWLQGRGDLGARIEHIVRRGLSRAPAAIALGADSPGLPPRMLDEAHAALGRADAVLGPTTDGGYYLLGLRRCPPGLLQGLPWSRADTFSATARRLAERGLSVEILEPWFDVDRPEDLARLRRRIDAGELHCPATAAIVRSPRVSAIVPVLDEERRIGRALAALRSLPGIAEIIVVDGGSRDRTVELAAEHPVRVVHAPRGRAAQMNAGAAIAAGEVLLFVHADTTLPAAAAARIADALVDPEVDAGAFRTRTVADAERPWFAPLLGLADLRSRYTRLPYGDQAIFVRATTFRQVGGYPAQPILEDLELARRLRAVGRIVTLRDTVTVSARRFVARPVWYTLAVNLFPLLYRLGVPPERLARLYADVR